MIQNQEFTYIGKRNSLKGDFEFIDQTHIAGIVVGNITVKNSHKLTLEIGSNINSVTKCFDLDVYGTFSGEIHSEGCVTFFPSAHFEGKIVAQHIEIFPGAIINMQGQTTVF